MIVIVLQSVTHIVEQFGILMVDAESGLKQNVFRFPGENKTRSSQEFNS